MAEKKLRLIVKVGTSTLIHTTGKLNLQRIDRIAAVLSDLRNQGHEVIFVSSGAIGVGVARMQHKETLKEISEKQAMAAIGQGVLMHIYEKSFSEYGQTVAQLLLTRTDFDDRSRYVNARNTIDELLKMDVLPIINENDTVSVEEIRFGDNDTLAALVGVVVKADLVVLLTDIDGLYTANPAKVDDAELITVVHDIDEYIKGIARGSNSRHGTGGMITKVQAAEIATHAGIPLIIANGARPQGLHDIMAGNSVGTLFLPAACNLHSRMSWLMFGSTPKGSITVDDGAKNALLNNGKSLLPSGIVSAEGTFNCGDVVAICDLDGQIIAKGISNYTVTDVLRIKGLHSAKIKDILPGESSTVVVHRDNMGIRK